MTNRYQPNEAQCPVPLELLARLMRISDEQANDTIQGLPERQRAELAVFCYGRGHLRDLGLKVAANCSDADLIRTAGVAGAVIAQQARQPQARVAQAGEPYKRVVSLARCA